MTPVSAEQIRGRPADADTDDLFHLETLAGLDNYQDWIVANFIPYLGGKAVEYGAGIGSISARLLPHVSSLDLVEPMEPLVTKLVSTFQGHHGVQVRHATLEDSARRTADAHYDSAVLVNVLEHIEDDHGALVELHRVLGEGGTACLFVPAMSFLYSAYDRLVGHHRRYELTKLKRLVRDAGFEIVRARYFDVLGVVPWLIAMRMAGQVNISPGLPRLYDSIAVPIGRAIERVVPPPIGKNIVLVGRKRVGR